MLKGLWILFLTFLFLFLNQAQANLAESDRVYLATSFNTFATFISTQSQIPEPFRQLLTHPQFKRKILKSPVFHQFVTDMQNRRPMLVSDDAPYTMEEPWWSKNSTAVFSTDLRFVYYPSHIDLVMERAALVNTCGKSLEFGTHPPIASTVSRDFLFALLFVAWQEGVTKNLPVRIEGKKLNSNMPLNQALMRAGFKPVFPASSDFINDSVGNIDWERTFENTGLINQPVTLQLNLQTKVAHH